MCLDSADVVRDEPIILKNKIEEQLIVGAFCVDSRDAGLYKSLGILRAARTKAHRLRVDGGTRATDIGRDRFCADDNRPSAITAAFHIPAPGRARSHIEPQPRTSSEAEQPLVDDVGLANRILRVTLGFVEDYGDVSVRSPTNPAHNLGLSTN